MKVLIVEDSKSMRAYLSAVLSAVPDITLMEPACDGVQAVRRAIAESPDVILMDLHLPEMDGIDAIGHIMAVAPCPIVVLSGELSRSDVDLTFESLQAGAVDVLRKPKSFGPDQVAGFSETLVARLRLLSQVRVMRRPHRAARTRRALVDPGFAVKAPLEIVVIGASTGGPPVLLELLKGLQRPFSLPMAISQHIAPGFEAGMCRWFRITGHDVRMACDGDTPERGRVYISPADGHLILTAERRFAIAPLPAGFPAPNVDLLFQSAAAAYGSGAAGVLLTGMGRDGARGMAEIRNAGGITIAQDAASCVVNGMPGAAVELGAAQHVLAPAGIVAYLGSAAQQSADLATEREAP